MKALFIVLFLGFYSCCIAQNNPLFLIVENNKTGFINAQGKIIIEPQYEYARDFSEGLAAVRVNGLYGFIDTTGKIVIKPQFDYANPFQAGLALVFNNKAEAFYIDKMGIPISKKKYKQAWSFIHNIAFVQVGREQFAIINQQDDFLLNAIFSQITDFKDGFAVVYGDKHKSYDNKKWQAGVIDTLGHWIIPYGKYKELENLGNGYFKGIIQHYTPSYKKIEVYLNSKNEKIQASQIISKIESPKNYDFFKKTVYDSTQNDSVILKGIMKNNGTIILEAILQELDGRGFHNGLLYCLIDKKLAYLNEQGHIIWKAQNTLPQTKSLNISYMMRGYFYAASAPHPSDLGGYASGQNHPRVITDTFQVPKQKLSIFVATEDTSIFKNQPYFMPVYITNNTSKELFFPAQDGRLTMNVQALTNSGVWADIEYLPSSWCGNSYHLLTLKPQEYWALTTYRYSGGIQTKLRIKLQYTPREQDWDGSGIWEGTTFLYSNEYDGSVNPAQFWRKQGYYPSGIMDPYHD